MFRIVLIILAASTSVYSARILGVFPIPSISHQVVFRALTQELAKRGHELVIITPNPVLRKDNLYNNVTEIDVSHSYTILEELLGDNARSIKRGVVMDVDMMSRFATEYCTFRLTTEIYKNKAVDDLIYDSNQHFDLIIVEAMLSNTLIFSKIFKAPVIWLSSFYGFPETFEAQGAPSRHPILYPHFLRNNFNNLSIIEKIQEIYYEYKFVESVRAIEEIENTFLKTKFGPNAPTVRELKKNVDLLFLNSRRYFDNNRPVPPSVVYLGALHLTPVKPLHEELQTYLDKSDRGVVYVSLGTNVRPAMMDKDLLDAFINAFALLPFDILWKFEGENVTLPSNVQVQKWFPQRDLLMHKNIKAFVTQGGLQSTDEAIDATVPLVGIPMLADQWYNVNKYVEKGIGVKLDALTLTADDLVKAVNTVVDNVSYKNNIIRIKHIINDEPESPLDRAVWWTEYILRHGGNHLRSPASDISWTNYLMLDVIAVLVSIATLIILLLVLVIYYLVNIVLSIVNERQKLKIS